MKGVIYKMNEARHPHRLRRSERASLCFLPSTWRHIDKEICNTGNSPHFPPRSYTMQAYEALILQCPSLSSTTSSGGQYHTDETQGKCRLFTFPLFPSPPLPSPFLCLCFQIPHFFLPPPRIFSLQLCLHEFIFLFYFSSLFCFLFFISSSMLFFFF